MGVLAFVGASGFVGRHATRIAAAAGHEVIAIARRPMAAADGVRTIQVSGYGASGEMADALRGASAVIYLAGHAHRPIRDAGARALAYHANAVEPVAVARAARDLGVDRFVFASTIGVLGEQTRAGAVLSSTSPYAPTSPYAEAKRDAEIHLHAMASDAFTPVALRPVLVYAHDAPGNFGRLLRLVRSGWPLPFAAVRNARSFVSVDNLSDALIAAALARARPPAALIIADDGRVSTTELLSLLATGMGQPSRLWPVPVRALRAAAVLLGRSDEMRRLTGDLAADNAEAKVHLEWTPRVAMREGLLEAARRFRRE